MIEDKLNEPWEWKTPSQWEQKEGMILLRLAAAHNALVAMSKVADSVKPIQDNPSIDQTLLANVFLWHMALVKETCKTVDQHRVHFKILLGQDSEIQALWNNVFTKYASNEPRSIGWLLGRIRDQTTFHWDCHVFKEAAMNPKQFDIPFAKGRSHKWRDNDFPLAMECVWKWIFSSIDLNPDVRQQIRALTDFSGEVCQLLENLIGARLLALRAEFQLIKTNQEERNEN